MQFKGLWYAVPLYRSHSLPDGRILHLTLLLSRTMQFKRRLHSLRDSRVLEMALFVQCSSKVIGNCSSPAYTMMVLHCPDLLPIIVSRRGQRTTDVLRQRNTVTYENEDALSTASSLPGQTGV